MKIYTRTGDAGDTGLFGGARVKKSDVRVEAYGTVDELNACLGVAASSGIDPLLAPIVTRIQNELFVVGAEVACEPGKTERLNMQLIGEEHIKALEQEIDEFEEHLPPLKNFILPSGSLAGAGLHLARTVARRAERRCLALPDNRELVGRYLNRLSDHLFVMARRQNHLAQAEERPWKPHG